MTLDLLILLVHPYILKVVKTLTKLKKHMADNVGENQGALPRGSVSVLVPDFHNCVFCTPASKEVCEQQIS